jgi:hypothetical protein
MKRHAAQNVTTSVTKLNEKLKENYVRGVLKAERIHQLTLERKRIFLTQLECNSHSYFTAKIVEVE